MLNFVKYIDILYIDMKTYISSRIDYKNSNIESYNLNRDMQIKKQLNKNSNSYLDELKYENDQLKNKNLYVLEQERNCIIWIK